MEQGSSAWLEWRSRKLGSSDAASVMRCSPYKTELELWLEKSQGKSFFVDGPHVERGNLLEPKIRARFEVEYDIDCPPTLFESKDLKFMVASLDGWNEDNRVILEIKVPGDEVFNKAKEGIIPIHYQYQMIHQMAVANAHKCFFVCGKTKTTSLNDLSITDMAVVEYYRNEEMLKDYVNKATLFWHKVENNIKPDLEDRDILIRDDLKDDYEKLYKLMKEQDELLEKAESYDLEINELKDKLKSSMKHTNERYGGIYFKKVNTTKLNQKKLLDSGVDLEKYQETTSYIRCGFYKEK